MNEERERTLRDCRLRAATMGAARDQLLATIAPELGPHMLHGLEALADRIEKAGVEDPGLRLVANLAHLGLAEAVIAQAQRIIGILEQLPKGEDHGA